MTQNITNPAALPILSGNVSDSGSGMGLPGVFVQAQSTNNLMAIGFTDTNGNFNLLVTSNQWKIKIKSDSGLAEKGYVSTQDSMNGNTYNGSASNLNFQFPKATALIYGTMTDTFSNTISGVIDVISPSGLWRPRPCWPYGRFRSAGVGP